MVGKSRYCEICGVRESLRGGFFARFPIDEQRCKTWVRLVGKEDLVHVPIEKLHEIRHVCGDHFQKRDFGKSGKRLKKKAYPTLNLSAPPLSDDQMSEFPQHVASKVVSASDQTIPVEKLPIQTPLEPKPSTSREPSQQASIFQNLTASIQANQEKRPRDAEECDGTGNVAKIRKISQADATPILDSDLNIPVEKRSEQSAPMEPIPSTSREPLSSCLIQNINAPLSTKHGLRTEFPGSSAPIAIGPESRITKQTNQKTDDTTKMAKLINQLKEVKSNIRSLRKSARLIENIESPLLQEIVSLAIKNQKRKPRGHRWTTKYKISCLAIFKRSPKAYRYLKHLVPLPCTKTLQNILQKVPMEPGINTQVLEHLRNVSTKYNKNDKYCCLLFDEMALKQRLNYNIKSDEVEGYTDMGKLERGNAFADHALVFMLQGIRRKFKQPVAFYFVKGTVSSEKLAAIIREVISAINETGFQVLATVCDQGPTNMGALKMLKEHSPTEQGPSIKNYFNVESKKIFIVYDVPHLFKSIRNNFMNYGEIKMGVKKAKWEHLKKVEERNRNLLYLSKITLNHVQPKYRAKMKVKYAAQALSNTVAAVLKLLALAEETPAKRKELTESGEVVHELDRLFDATNGPSGPDDVKRGQRENVSSKTNHVSTWAQYKKLLETLTFHKEGIQAKNVRCIQGYLTTLCSLRDVWDAVQRLGFKYLNLRQLNQDALENFFGLIRQHSPTNRNPTVSSFMAALKTSIISGMSAPHSRGSNCQRDANLLLTDLHNIVFEADSKSLSDEKFNESKPEENKENENMENFTLHIPEENEEEETEMNLLTVEAQPIVYVSGYLAMCIFKSHKCPMCRDCLTTANPENDDTFMYIKLREWWKDRPSLTYPNINVCKYVENCVNIFEAEVIPILHQPNIRTQTVTLFMANWNGSFIKCDVHRSMMFHVLSYRLAILLIRRQCQRINSKFSSQEEYLAGQNKKAQQQGIGR